MKILLIVFQQLVKVCSFMLKIHLYFHISTVPEPQPKVQQTEQVEILPAPGEIWYTVMNSSLHACSMMLLSLPVSPPCTCILCKWQPIGKIKHFLPSFKQTNQHPNVGHTSGHQVTSVICYITVAYCNSISKNYARFAKQQVLCVQTVNPIHLLHCFRLSEITDRTRKRPSVENENVMLFVTAASQVITTERKSSGWKALFTGSLFLWQQSLYRAGPSCQYLISVGVNWHKILKVMQRLL